METIGGATAIFPHPGGAVAEAEGGPTMVAADLTAGAYSAMVGSVPEGYPAPPLHRHPHTDETFYVAEGELTFRFPDREVVAPAGTFVFVPRGVVHTVGNSGRGPMRGILLISPVGAEHVFETVEDASG